MKNRGQEAFESAFVLSVINVVGSTPNSMKMALTIGALDRHRDARRLRHVDAASPLEGRRSGDATCDSGLSQSANGLCRRFTS
jgi:hypothetical protein